MEDQELSQALKSRATYHKAPAALRAQVLDAVQGSPTATTVARATIPARTAPSRGWNWLGLGGAFAFGLVLAFGVSLGLGLAPGGGLGSSDVTRQAVASHVRSLMASHLTDVASTDQHTVKPWFNGKVDFSPPVVDLANDGYPLTGGRLDYLEQRTVAALVYKRRAHPINLFVWPDAGSEQAVQNVAEQGYHVVQWRHAGMRYVAVSDVNPDELKVFVDEYRQHTAGQ